MFKSSLLLCENGRQELAYLALGKEVPISFFRDINAADQEASSPNQCTFDQAEDINIDMSRVPAHFNMPMDQKGVDNYNNIIHKINDQFMRIGEVLQNDANMSNIPQLQVGTFPSLGAKLYELSIN